MANLKKTILIVDDEHDMLGLMVMVFEAEGYAIRVAHDGKAAMEMLAELPYPDLVLSDIMMPVMDGYELVRAIKSHANFQNIPIIVLSAAQLDEKKIANADYVGFFRKPFDLKRLISSVEEVITARKSG